MNGATLLLGLAGLAADAHAFCGTYVGEPGADLTNSASQMAVVRQGDLTTLTMVNDYQGAASEFAMVIPVPADLSPEDVSVVDDHLVRTLEVYSGPRLVEYTCEDMGGWTHHRDFEDEDASTKSHTPLFAAPFLLGGCSDSELVSSNDTLGGYGDVGTPSDEAASAVSVEAEFAAGEYDFVLLEAEDAEGLLAWLDAEGYAVGDDALDTMATYVESGSRFLAAKVRLDRAPEEGANLSPIQLQYRSEGFSLPIRLGTLNSGGEQDLILYTVTDYQEGQVGISNYPQAEIEDECLIRSDEWPSFADYYNAQFDEAFTASDGFVWVREYGWAVTPSWVSGTMGASSLKCDPCPMPSLFPPASQSNPNIPAEDYDPLPDELIEALGFEFSKEGDTGFYNPWGPQLYVGRLHLRYTPEAVDQDLVLYANRIVGQEQIRFIDHSAPMESAFPICGEGWADEPSECEYGIAPAPKWGLLPMACSSSGSPVAGFGALLLALGLVRRRS